MEKVKANSKKFGKILDNILIYSKSNNYYFKTEYKMT